MGALRAMRGGGVILYKISMTKLIVNCVMNKDVACMYFTSQLVSNA